MKKEVILEKDNDTVVLNALLQKAEGDVDNLSSDELYRLQQLCTKRMLIEYSRKLITLYPGVPILSAGLREEMHQHRKSQKQMAELIGCSYQHFNKVLSGYNHIAMSFAKKLQRIGIDGNFIIKNAEI